MSRICRFAVVGALVLAPLALGSGAGAITDETIVYSNGRKVFTIESDGLGKSKLFVPETGRTCCVEYSPDGSRVLFVDISKGASDVGLKVAKTDGSATYTVAPKKWDVISWDWRPDGKQVAFNVFKKDRRGIYIARPNGNGRKKIYEGSSGGDLRWNHDGTKLSFNIFVKNKGRIVYWDSTTGQLSQVPEDPSLDASGATWSPTMDAFFFFVFEGNDESSVLRLYAVDADGSGLTALSGPTEFAGSAYWTPDGERIVYQTCCADESLRDRIYLVDPDGTNQVQLAEDTDAPGVQSSLFLHPFAPDGTIFAYEDYSYDAESFESLSNTLFVSDVAGNADPVYDDPELNFLGWSPDSSRLLACRFSEETEGIHAEIVTVSTGVGESLLKNTCDADWART